MFRQLVKINPEIHTNLSLAVNLNNVKFNESNVYSCDPAECCAISYYDVIKDSKYNSLYNINLSTDDYFDDIQNVFYNYIRQKSNLLYELCVTESNADGCITSKPYYLNYKLYNKKFIIFAPFYITSLNDIPNVCVLDIYITSSFNKKTYIQKQLIINIDNRKINEFNPNVNNTNLYKYLYKYLSNDLFRNTFYIKHTSINNKYDNQDELPSDKISYDIKCYNYDESFIQKSYKNIKYDQYFIYDEDSSLLSHVNETLNNIYKNQHLYDHHIVPISFCFTIDDILTNEEKYFFKNCQFKVNAHYANYSDDLSSLVYNNYYDIYDDENKLDINYVNYIDKYNVYKNTKTQQTLSNDFVNVINSTGINYYLFENYKYTNSMSDISCTYKYNRYELSFILKNTDYKIPIKYYNVNINNDIYDFYMMSTNYNAIANNQIGSDYENIKINF